MFAGLAWKTVGSWIFKLLPIILIVGIVLYAVLVIIPENKKLKADLADAAEKYEQLEERFTKYEENVGLLTAGVGAQITIRTQQSTVKDRMRDVEVTTKDEPFADDGLRARAGVLRDYQKTSPVFGSADR